MQALEELARIAGRKQRKKPPTAEAAPLHRKKRAGNPKKSTRKGGTFEGRIAKAFEAWIPDCTVKRVPRSGGWSAAAEFGVKGDLVFSAKHARYHVECKNREGWDITDLITGVRATGELSIEAWWKQTVKDCPKGRTPLLVFTRNAHRRVDYLMVYEEDLSFMDVWAWELAPHFFVGNDHDRPRVVMMLDDFFKVVRPPKAPKKKRRK